MSQTPIFDALFEEFLEAHRWTPSANTPNEADFINLDPPIPFVEDTQEIPAVEPAPSIIENLKELHSQPVETFGERIAREIEAQKAVAEMPDWMTSGELYKPFEIEAGPELMAMLNTNPFVDLMAEHQHNILYPVTMPTRDAIGWTPREIETPALEPEEAEHVFPLTRDYHGRRRFLQKPSVTKIREIVENAVFEHTPA
jgi:hypothetical protein